jgi:selenocysteine-specific elongation factor
VQSHGASVDEARPGHRAAIALAGVEVAELHRGAVVVSDDAWEATRVLRADVALLDGTPPLGPRTRVRFHLGTMELGARVVAAGGPLRAGERRAARVVLDGPVVARAGDRFVLRAASPPATIGGGLVTDPQPPGRRARPWRAPALDPAVRLALMIAEAGGQGLGRAHLPVRIGASPREVRALLEGAGSALVTIGGRVVGRDALAALGARLRAVVAAHHERAPLEPGAPLQSIRAALTVPAEVAEEALRRELREGAMEQIGALVRIRGWTPALTPAQRGVMRRLAHALAEAGREPPSVSELSVTHGDDVPALLRLLERDGVVAQVEDGRYYDLGALRAMLSALRKGMTAGREYGPAELRDILGVSRKYLIPLLEYCDRTGVTDRRSAGRVIHGTQLAPDV